jgi:hypothetical protein
MVPSVRGFDTDIHIYIYICVCVCVCVIFPYHCSMCFIFFSLRKELFFSDHSGLYASDMLIQLVPSGYLFF